MKLLGKIIIRGTLETLTGLHIGGSKSSLAIGGIDNNVIVSALDQPYIPGSSLKGKLRSLLAKAQGSLFFNRKKKADELKQVKKLLLEKTADGALKKYKDIVEKADTDEDFSYIMELFGYSGDADDKMQVGYTRLFVRDAYLENPDSEIFKNGFTHSKWENVINRRTGTAEHPRQMERVPAGAQFNFELVYNMYDDVEDEPEKLVKHLQGILLALQLLGDDGIGGQLSRGYGQVQVSVSDILCKLIDIQNLKYETMDTLKISEQGNQLLTQLSSEFGKTE